MLREILRDNIDGLFQSIQKIAKAFEIIRGKNVDSSDIMEIKRLIHSLKGNLQSIGMNDEAEVAIQLEEDVFRLLKDAGKSSVFVSTHEVDDWFIRLNSIEFSLKGYLF